MLKNPINTEKQLLQQLTFGNEDAFKQIYQLYSARLYGKLFRLVKSDLQAKELLQDIFLKIWNNRQNIDLEKSFRSYVFQIATNTTYDFFRKVVRDKLLQTRLLKVAILEYSHIEEELLNKEKRESLYRAIDLLPPQRKKIFTLCKIEGKSYEEVGRELGISCSTISDHIVKANHFIRKYFYVNA